MICLYSDGMRETIPENELRLLKTIRPYLLFDDNHDAYLKDDAPEEVHAVFSEYMQLIQNKKTEKETYNAICKKLNTTSIEELCKELHDYYEIRKNDTASLDYYPLQCLTPKERDFLLEYVNKHGLDS